VRRCCSGTIIRVFDRPNRAACAKRSNRPRMECVQSEPFPRATLHIYLFTHVDLMANTYPTTPSTKRIFHSSPSYTPRSIYFSSHLSTIPCPNKMRSGVTRSNFPNTSTHSSHSYAVVQAVSSPADFAAAQSQACYATCQAPDYGCPCAGNIVLRTFNNHNPG
jgi:hypothetical protein